MLNYIGQVIIARLLVPADFGIIALITVFIGFAAIFSDFGLGSALIQQRDLGDDTISAVFRFSVFGALFLTGSLWAAAPIMEDFYGVEGLRGLTRLLAIGFFASSVSLVPRALLQRDMRFKLLAQADVVATFLGLLATIAIALKTRSPVAIAIGAVVSSSAGTLLVWRGLGHYTWMSSRGQLPRRIWSYGGNLVGFTIINYWARNVDNLLIGKWLGPVSLGLYSRAYNLMLLPVNQVVAALNPVILPTLAALQRDTERFRRAYLSAVRAIAFVTFPMMAGLAVTAYPFIALVFGAKWIEAVPLVQILAWVGLLQSLTNPVGLIYLATGSTARMLQWGLLGSSACVVALVIGALLGSARAVASAYLLVNILLTYPAIAFAGVLVELRFYQVLDAIKHTVLATGLMTTSVFLAEHGLTSLLPVTQRLLADVVLGAGVYAVVSLIIRNPAVGDFKRFLTIKRSTV